MNTIKATETINMNVKATETIDFYSAAAFAEKYLANTPLKTKVSKKAKAHRIKVDHCELMNDMSRKRGATDVSDPESYDAETRGFLYAIGKYLVEHGYTIKENNGTEKIYEKRNQLALEV